MAILSKSATGLAGVHYVAFRLSAMGYTVALTSEGAPSVDLLVTNVDGSKAVSVQVKTKTKAFGGRKGSLEESWLFWPISPKKRDLTEDSLIYAFVDLRKDDLSQVSETVPEVFIVPAKDVSKLENRDPWPKNSANPTMDYFWIPMSDKGKWLNWGPIQKVLG